MYTVRTMVTRKLQGNEKRSTDKDGNIVREWGSYNVTIPPDLVESLKWEKGTEIDITIGADKGDPVLILRRSKK